MPAYNFQGRFAEGILDGSKRQTIRVRRKRPTKSGDVLQLYTGQRTKACRLLRVVDCTSVVPVIVNIAYRYVKLDGKVLSSAEERLFAERDGFTDVDEFFAFFATYKPSVQLSQLEVIYWR